MEIVIGDCSEIGVGAEVVGGADSDFPEESDTAPASRFEQLVESQRVVDAALLSRQSSDLDLATGPSGFEAEKGQIALSDSSFVALESLLVTVVGQMATDSSSARRRSAVRTASDSTARATGSDSLLAASCARTSRRARRPSLAPNLAAALVVATSPARLRAQLSASSSLLSPYLKT